MVKSLEQALHDSFEVLIRRLSRDVKAILADVAQQFENLLLRDVQSPPERMARAALGRVLCHATPETVRIQEEMEAIKGDYDA